MGKIKEQLNDMIPTIPPENYKGSVGKWMVELQTRGHWDGENPDWHGDVMIPESEWSDMLKTLE